MKKKTIYEKYIKRILDVILSFLALVFLSPVYAIVAILVRIKLGSPVIFKQERIGYKNQKFVLYKFRTMTDDKDENGELLPDALRLTKFGKTLRSLSIDELPELVNILKGDMSIIGPRPLSVEYLDYYTEEELRRHSVMPGLSGLAQVNGRNSISWEEKFKYDLEYLEHITFIGDCKIVLKTLKKVLLREDIGQGENEPISLDVERRNQIRRK